MGKEIEHKYLVKDDSFITLAYNHTEIKQGYICRDKERTVRVRLRDGKGTITIKGETRLDTRDEYEYAIPAADAQMLLDTICIKPIIEKVRFLVEYQGNKWEVDQFRGSLEGLVIAEIEIPSSDYKYDVPPFVGRNVTNDARYYNSNLISGIIPKE